MDVKDKKQKQPLATLESIDGISFTYSLAALIFVEDFYNYLKSGKFLYALEVFVGVVIGVTIFGYFFKSVVSKLLSYKSFFSKLNEKVQKVIVYICLTVVFAITIFVLKGIFGLK